MKLKSIKLAGFKSFVDPTLLDLRSNLVGVVGPNGCGKSNVIDAVRWVMGESSAKTLRGESITDVIFNGSNTRKPVGQASIDLLFDNSDGTIGGEYASYAEISIRREVSRDAVSNYYLNGTRCRRRDIVDVFLGTGLGSRSYSIIEQGMISRVIESKPEDLRNFIEEAAGISVYKKRRHETELRMQHTTENLARLSDLREEQVKLLERLKRQSESAQKYQAYMAEKDQLAGQLLALRWRDYDSKLAAHAEQIRNLSVTLEEKLAARATINADLEKLRLQHEEKSDKHATVQSKFYELGSLIARNEQSLQHYKDRKLQLEADVEQIKQAIADITEQKATDSGALFECEERLHEITPEYEQALAAAQQAEELYLDARFALDSCNEEWENLQQRAQEPQQQAELQKARIEHLDKQTRDLQTRVERLQQENTSMDIAGVELLVATLNTEQQNLEQQSNALKAAITSTQNSISTQRNELQQLQDQLNHQHSLVQQNKGRQAGLLALQQAALGKDHRGTQEWLNQHNLGDATRVAEALTVAAGWEQAVETVLADYLEAVCVEDQLSDVVAAVNSLTAGKITLMNTAKIANSAVTLPTISLATKITTELPIVDLLQDILVADDLLSALHMRDQLQGGQSIVTKDGIWLGRSWLRVSREEDSFRGVLHREQELQALKLELDAQIASVQTLEQAIQGANANLHSFELALQEQQQNESGKSAELREISSKFSAMQQKLENMLHRRQRITSEIAEHDQQLTSNSADSVAARTDLEVAIEAMASFAAQKEHLVAQREQLVVKEKTLKQQAKEYQAQLHELEITKQTFTTKYQGLQHTISRVDQQLGDLHKRHSQLQQNLQDDLVPVQRSQAELDELLIQRSTVEENLNQARAELEAFDTQMKAQQKQRADLEQAADGIKEVLDQCKLERQTLDVRRETINEQLAVHNIDINAVLQTMPQDAAEDAWEQRIASLENKIKNLGAINLAAMEELDTETQRQAYLESQFNDLQEALTTLDNAIKKIDRETRSKFKETFDQINANFGALFPKLFGGGKAYLEIIGEDLLCSGVTVMAMPPGKKNSTIHLLSGGEKALTAVSLVFSIFQLNPAPFCMLDEVDAPLDESNVARFGNLIKEMSQKVQFVLITHNKATMEIVNQLIGVTMKEPGVSRLVSVDINEAVEMAIA